MSTIKSEKAKEYLNNQLITIGDPCAEIKGVFQRRAEKAISIAEQDAEVRDRDKAVRVFKSICFHRDKDWCSISPTPIAETNEYDCGNSCDNYCDYCGVLENFLKAYDNE